MILLNTLFPLLCCLFCFAIMVVVLLRNENQKSERFLNDNENFDKAFDMVRNRLLEKNIKVQMISNNEFQKSN